jgi:hypothetical protein
VLGVATKVGTTLWSWTSSMTRTRGPAGQLREREVEGQHFALLRVDAVLLAPKVPTGLATRRRHRARPSSIHSSTALITVILWARVEAFAIATVVAANKGRSP